MSSHLRFEGPASEGLSHIVLAVERKLNWQAVQAAGAADAPSAASGDCVQGVNCPGNIGGHQVPANIGGHQVPEFEFFVTVALLILVALVAFVLGFLLGSRTSSGPGK